MADPHDPEADPDAHADADAEDEAEADEGADDLLVGADEGADTGPDDVIEVARRRHGGVGAVIAAGMLGLEQALGRKPKEEAPIVVASNSDPEDIDADGITIDVDDERSVVAPPLPRRGPADAPGASQRKRTKRRRDG